jgi:mevalonate kinase
LENFNKDLNNRLYLKSTIPQSYGLGSSGAVVAAIYSRYSFDKISERIQSPEEMEKLCRLFSTMESYFHGKSSGIDPLTIYLNKPLLISKEKKLSVVDFIEKQNKTDISIYLIDSGKPSKTNPLVKDFMNQFAPDEKMNAVANELIELTDECIKNLLNKNYIDFLHFLCALSNFQLINMNKFIPEKMCKVWKEGLKSESLIMKLCGSGGGGYLIAFASDKNKAQQFIKSNNLQYIPVNINNNN